MLPLADFGSEDPYLGRVLDGVYRLERLIARGGMGAVYEAQHLRLGSRVAVKILHSPFGADPALEARFEREINIVKQLDHPHIVRVEDADRSDDGVRFFVMEYLAGETLGKRLRRDGVLPMAEAIRIASDVCATLSQVHARGFVHCDMKPANIFLQRIEGEPDFVKLLDFGVSIDLQQHSAPSLETVIAGTPNYMAPEQARGERDLDARVDQFAVAAITYEMLTGRKALLRDDSDGSGVQPCHVTPLSELAPWLPAAFDAVLARALSTERGSRYPSMAQFAAALAHAAAHAGIGADGGASLLPQSGRYHVATPREEQIDGVSGRPSGPPTLVDGHRGRAPSGNEQRDPLVRVQELIGAMRASYSAGMCYEAAEHAEELLDMALSGAPPPTLRAIVTGMPLIDRVFAALVGPLDGLLARAEPSDEAPRPMSPRASSVFALLERPMTVAELLETSQIPTRDCIRVLAALLRSRILVRSSGRTA